MKVAIRSLSLTGSYRLETGKASEVGFRSDHVAEMGVPQYAGPRSLGSAASCRDDLAEDGLSR